MKQERYYLNMTIFIWEIMPVHPTEHVLLKSYTNSLYKQSTSYLNWAAILLY